VTGFQTQDKKVLSGSRGCKCDMMICILGQRISNDSLILKKVNPANPNDWQRMSNCLEPVIRNAY
jgi:hypothetical protein